MNIGSIPWLLALLTALWFGLMAWQAGRSWILWAVSGAVFGLVTATLILGLARAMTIPFSDHERSAGQTEWTVAVIIVVALLGWLLTLGLHRHHLALWKLTSSTPQPTSTMAGTTDSKAVK